MLCHCIILLYMKVLFLFFPPRKIKIFLKDFICLFLERGEGGEKEKHGSVASGTCPDWEWNWRLSCRMMLDALNHAGQGQSGFFFLFLFFNVRLVLRCRGYWFIW